LLDIHYKYVIAYRERERQRERERERERDIIPETIDHS